ncbi:MAG: hypothetical protein ABI284_00220 [Nitrosospira sp.]
MNNMPSKKSIISLALGSALAATLGTASIASAADSPFTAQSLNKGYMVAGSHDYGAKKDGHGDKKCGEGKCGMAMADTDNDGRVSRDEHARHAEMMFDKMDTNNDGYIDKDEANAAKKMRRHGHGHGHGHGYDKKSGDGYESNVNDSNDVNYRKFPHMKPMGV